MKSIGISEFKAKCISLLKELQNGGGPLIVTHRGQPVARIESIARPGSRTLGLLRHTGRIKADLVTLDWSSEWESGD